MVFFDASVLFISCMTVRQQTLAAVALRLLLNVCDMLVTYVGMIAVGFMLQNNIDQPYLYYLQHILRHRIGMQ